MRKALFFCFLIFFLFSCKKKEIENIEVVTPDNVAPPDNTIPNVIKENYANKAYISVLGRKPTSSEHSQGKTILDKNNLSVADRNEMLDTILSKSGYNQRLYDISLVNLLNNLDTAQITQFIDVFTILLTDTAYSAAWPQIQDEKTRLEILKGASGDLESGTINIIGLHRRCAYNYFYDQLNMGTENFVVSMFQNFLFRYPTDEELTQGKLMVDGFEGVLFFQSGKSKDEFLNIFFASGNYFEGQVRDLFLKYLFREPNSIEMSSKTTSFKNSLDYKVLQKEILAMDEYVGL